MSQCSVNTTLGPGTLQESFGVTVRQSTDHGSKHPQFGRSALCQRQNRTRGQKRRDLFGDVA
jgi:hypothetical protein